MCPAEKPREAVLENSLSDLVTWRPGRLAKSTFAMTAGMGLRTLAQAAVFLIVARVLGVADYGAYSAVLALAITLGGFRAGCLHDHAAGYGA